jgi:hypothetical protein
MLDLLAIPHDVSLLGGFNDSTNVPVDGNALR